MLYIINRERDYGTCSCSSVTVEKLEAILTHTEKLSLEDLKKEWYEFSSPAIIRSRLKKNPKNLTKTGKVSEKIFNEEYLKCYEFVDFLLNYKGFKRYDYDSITI